MGWSAALDVVLGLVFVYLVLSLIGSGLNETLASILALRAKFLREGIANLLDDPDVQGLAKLVYAHPVSRSLTRHRGRIFKQRYPSYFPAEKFSLVLLDRVAPAAVDGGADAAAAIERGLKGIDNAHVRETLELLYREARGDADAFRRAVERWFDDAMERVSGWYRRRVQLFLWLIALVLAVSLNIDTLQLARTLWTDDTLREALVARAEATAAEDEPPALAEVAGQVDRITERSIPFGWTDPGLRPDDAVGWLAKAAGLLVTAAAITFGAPFWFDLLNRLAGARGGMRGSGPRPGAAA